MALPQKISIRDIGICFLSITFQFSTHVVRYNIAIYGKEERDARWIKRFFKNTPWVLNIAITYCCSSLLSLISFSSFQCQKSCSATPSPISTLSSFSYGWKTDVFKSKVLMCKIDYISLNMCGMGSILYGEINLCRWNS